jgi:DNA-nicking Smr family endonuclease
MKKKFTISTKDKKEWTTFTDNLKNIKNKDEFIEDENIKNKKTLKLDLHGFSLKDANNSVKNFIEDAHRKNFKKLLIITGKGLRSKVYDDPYRSTKMNVLKDSVPQYIKENADLSEKIKKITEANQKDGGEGAFYIYLK